MGSHPRSSPPPPQRPSARPGARLQPEPGPAPRRTCSDLLSRFPVSAGAVGHGVGSSSGGARSSRHGSGGAAAAGCRTGPGPLAGAPGGRAGAPGPGPAAPLPPGPVPLQPQSWRPGRARRHLRNAGQLCVGPMALARGAAMRGPEAWLLLLLLASLAGRPPGATGPSLPSPSAPPPPAPARLD